MLLHHLFETTAARLPENPALVADGQRLTYGEMNRRADLLAAELQQRGVQRGDRVTLFLDNSVEMVIGIYAALKAGAVFMPVNPLTKAHKLTYLLQDSEATVLLTHRALQSVWHQSLAQAPSVRCCMVAGANDAGGREVDARVAALPPLDGAGGRPQYRGTIDQDLASIIYTSGSTGDPKGVMLTHLNMVSAARSISTYLELQQDDIILCALPLAFDYGLYQILMSGLVGSTVVLERSFTFPVKVLEVMVREKVTVFPGVPTMFAMLMALNTLSAFDLSALRSITNTAAALPEDHILKLRRLFPQARLFSMYGLTECKRVTYLPPDQLDVRPTSVGRGMPNEEVWLVDEAGRRLPNGSTGELVIRGSNVMRGYWRKPEETAKRLKPGPLPGEMVLYSGDIFRTDDEGYLYFVARKDDIIKSRGEKVSPREVENVIYKLDGVLECAVVGVPDDVLGQAIKAVVALKPGFSYQEREIIKHCMAHIESFMVPKYVEFVDGLPKTDTGKIKKTGLA
jgi:amino acid adenylation domain-containing protein